MSIRKATSGLEVAPPGAAGLLSRMEPRSHGAPYRSWSPVFSSVSERDLDTFMAFYNFRRTHQGYRVAGRTPAKALYDLIAEQWLLPPISEPGQEVPLAS